RDLMLLSETLSHGAGAAAYVFTAWVSDGAEADWVFVFSVGLLSAAASWVASGPEDRAQPAAARTTTGDRRAVRAIGREEKEGTAHFSWGKVRRESALRTGRQCHTHRSGAEGSTRSVGAR